MSHLKISMNNAGFRNALASLQEASEVLPGFGDAILCLLDSGEELFLIRLDDAAAPLAGELFVRLDPSDSLLRLVAAFRARQPEALVLKHFPLPSSAADSSITREAAQ